VKPKDDEQPRLAIARGALAFAPTVGRSLGPAARARADVERLDDGMQIARDIQIEDPLEKVGAQLLKEVATKTGEAVGDGTATAVVLCQAMISEGIRQVTAGTNPMLIRIGIEKAVEAVVAEIKKQSRPIDSLEEIAAIATISAADPEVGDLIAEVASKVGKDGVVTVEEGQSLGLEKKYTEGMQFDRGYISAYFVTGADRMEAVLDNPRVLVTNTRASAVMDLLPALEAIVRIGRPLLIIAEDVDGEALQTLVLNHLHGTIEVVAVKAPGVGDCRKEMLRDIAILTGGTVISEEIGRRLDSVTLDDLGEARRVVATKDDTTIVEGAGAPDAVKARISQIRAQIKETTSDYDREKLQERLAKLAGGVAVIKVGAATEVELKEKKHRIEDALSTVRAGIEEGMVAGGGATLLHCQAVLDKLKMDEPDAEVGVAIVRRALEYPIRQIADNAGAHGEVVVDQVRGMKVGFGYDALRGVYGDMFEKGIVDAAKVTRSALENAASIAKMVLTTETLITDTLATRGQLTISEEALAGGGPQTVVRDDGSGTATGTNRSRTPFQVAEQQHVLLNAFTDYWPRREALSKTRKEALGAALERERDREIASIEKSHREMGPLVQAKYVASTASISQIARMAQGYLDDAQDWRQRWVSAAPKFDEAEADIRRQVHYPRTDRITTLDEARAWLEVMDRAVGTLPLRPGRSFFGGRQHIEHYQQVRLVGAEILQWTKNEFRRHASQRDRELAEIARSDAQAQTAARARYESQTQESRTSAGLAGEASEPPPPVPDIIDGTLAGALSLNDYLTEVAATEFVTKLGMAWHRVWDPERNAIWALSAAVAELRIQADEAGPLVSGKQRPVIDPACTVGVSGPVRLGTIAHPQLASLPALASLNVSRHLFVEGVSPKRPASLVCSVLLRLVLGSAPGSVRLTLIDPVGAGAGLAGFLALPVESRGDKVYVRPDEIEAQLRDLNRVVETTIQTRLGTRYQTLAEYNEANPAVAVPYQLIAILGLPAGGWTERHAELLMPLLSNGPRAGAHVLATLDRDVPTPRGVNLETISSEGLCVTLDGEGQGELDLYPELKDKWAFVSDDVPEAGVVETLLKAWADAAEDSKTALGHGAVAVPVDWSGKSIDGLEVSIGLKADGHVHDFSLGSGTVHHALVGGMSGSGKTNLLRLLIAQLASRYSPDELGLYLLDFKAGVAFADYLDLPNARAVSLETEREFALSMLRHLQGEIEARAKLFRAAGVDEFVPYRRTGHSLARLLLIMDEFQVLFGEDDALAREASRILEDLVKRGRSFGIHILLASQSPSLASLAGQRIYNQMGLRIAFRCLSQDALAILGEGNTGAAELDDPGEAIYNDELGAREHNQRIRVALLTQEEHKSRIGAIAALGAGRYPSPVTFEGATLASLESNALLAAALRGETTPGSPESVEIWLGEPVELKAPTSTVLERYPRSNLLVAGPDEETAYGLLGAALLSIAAAQPDAQIHVIDLARPTAPVAGILGRLAAPFGDRVERCGPRESSALLGRIITLLDERLAGSDADAAGPTYLIVAGLQRWRELRGPDSFQQTSEAKALLRLLDEGPDQSIHTIAWTDTVGALEKVKSRAWGFFDLRVALHLSETDSTNLLGSAVASRLPDNRALYRHEDWPAGQLEKFKPYRV
jgi:chaperonin GroEL